ncbi:hypothetical protein AKO1_010386 [Acrasis kona]|uniref:RanBD1 domain-containing protein n=1 Tax=Acrasis kona TaxID=1008807 RepID=A0AAW2YPQ8_9EUKA
MSKRGAERQLTKDDNDNESGEDAGSYEIASAEDISKRRIVKPKRRGNKPQASEEASTSGFTFTTTPSQTPFVFTSNTSSQPTTTTTSTGGFQFNVAPGSKDSDRIAALENEVKQLKEQVAKLVEKVGLESESTPSTVAQPEKTLTPNFTFSAKPSSSSSGTFQFSLPTDSSSSNSFSIPKFDFGSTNNVNSFSDAAKTSGASFLDSSQNESSQQDSQQDSQAGDDDIEAPPSSVNDAPPSLTLADEAQVSHATGEEGETTLNSAKVKLFELEKSADAKTTSWKERGIGMLKLNQKKDTGKSRLIMRKENVGTLLLNAFIFADMKCEKPQDKSLSVSIFADNSVKHYLFKFLKAEQCDEFKTAVESAKKK